MATESENAQALKSIKTQLDAVTAQVVALKAQITTLTNQVAALTAEKAALVLSNQTLQATINEQAVRIAELEATPPPVTNPESSAEMTQAVGDVKTASQSLSDAVGGVYLRPVVPTPEGAYFPGYSEGLGTWAADSGDFSSDNGQAIMQPDDPRIIGVARVRPLSNDHAVPNLSPVLTSYPDGHAVNWMTYGGVTLDQIGQPIAIARGYGYWSECALILTEKGYVGAAGTATAESPWDGILLPPNKKPTSIAMTNRSEFAVVSVIDTDTGKGELAVIVLWGGQDLAAPTGTGSWHDWPTSHPGLPGPGIFTGMKILGYVDLGLAAPTRVSCAANWTSDRIQNVTDGNAGSLGMYDLSKQYDRDGFYVGHPKLPDGSSNDGSIASNPNYIASSGLAVVISETENRAVVVDLTPLFEGYRKQYLTTQELYNATLPIAYSEGWTVNTWWKAYSQDDDKWPNGFISRPDLKPTIRGTVTVQAPTSVLVAFGGSGEFAVGTQSGAIQFFNPNLAPEGSKQAGPNVCHLTYDKFTGLKGFFAVSRGDKTIHRYDNMGGAANETLVIRDPRMIDPVACEVADTHNVGVGLLNVADEAGKQLLAYRYTPYVAIAFGGAEYPIQGDLGYECTGIVKLPGKVIGWSGTNVN